MWGSSYTMDVPSGKKFEGIKNMVQNMAKLEGSTSEIY